MYCIFVTISYGMLYTSFQYSMLNVRSFVLIACYSTTGKSVPVKLI